MTEMPTEQQIEAYIDRHSVQHLLVLIGNLCAEKAAHIEANWQDAPLAKRWRQAGSVVDTCARDKRIDTLP